VLGDPEDGVSGWQATPVSPSDFKLSIGNSTDSKLDSKAYVENIYLPENPMPLISNDCTPSLTSYNPKYDVALLQLSNPVSDVTSNSPSIRPLALAPTSTGSSLVENASQSISGYGFGIVNYSWKVHKNDPICSGKPTDKLPASTLNMTKSGTYSSPYSCVATFYMCTQGNGLSYVAPGDSGGPMVLEPNASVPVVGTSDGGLTTNQVEFGVIDGSPFSSCVTGGYCSVAYYDDLTEPVINSWVQTQAGTVLRLNGPCEYENQVGCLVESTNNSNQMYLVEQDGFAHPVDPSMAGCLENQGYSDPLALTPFQLAELPMSNTNATCTGSTSTVPTGFTATYDYTYLANNGVTPPWTAGWDLSFSGGVVTTNCQSEAQSCSFEFTSTDASGVAYGGYGGAGCTVNIPDVWNGITYVQTLDGGVSLGSQGTQLAGTVGLNLEANDGTCGPSAGLNGGPTPVIWKPGDVSDSIPLFDAGGQGQGTLNINWSY
jgi:hypothetical protein